MQLQKGLGAPSLGRRFSVAEEAGRLLRLTREAATAMGIPEAEIIRERQLRFGFEPA